MGKTMRLGSYLLDKTKDEFFQGLSMLANARDTLVFLDTNILAYLYKLHTAARLEFFAWTDSALADKRLYIPAWCAGEYLARLRNGELNSYTPKSKDADQPRNALETMLETASLFVDEQVLKSAQFPGSRDDYLAKFRDAIDALGPFTRVFKHQFVPADIHEEIMEHLEPIVLDSPLAQLCDRAAKEGPARIEHRLPPAYRDDEKPENRLGDLIIWLEMLDYCKRTKDDHANVLFLTNDEKSDWVYAPLKRIELVVAKRIAVPNRDPTLRIIDPRLVSEFRQMVGHERISICSLAALVQGISKTDPARVSQLAAAIQIDSSTERTGAVPANVSPSETGLVGTAVIAESADLVMATARITAQGKINAGDELDFELDGYQDGAYEFDAPGEINEIIGELRSHNWYTQNPAIENIRTIREKIFPPTSWFVLGRNIYQAACGNAQKAMDFMANLGVQLKRFPGDVSQYLLAGMVFEIYFDSQGDLRQAPKASYLGKALGVISNPEYERVRTFVRTKLRQAGAQLLFFPGDDRKFALVIESQSIDEATATTATKKKRQLTSVRLEEIELLIDAEQDPTEQWSLFTQAYSAEGILEEISSSLLIPRWAIIRQFNPTVRSDVTLLVPDGRWLQPQIAAPSSGAGHLLSH
jgi:hypothetical protein